MRMVNLDRHLHSDMRGRSFPIWTPVDNTLGTTKIEFTLLHNYLNS